MLPAVPPGEEIHVPVDHINADRNNMYTEP
jgi:hypothetical protein